uniref:DNA-binding protein H-NS-like C-terminal domain-containing protein n=1 Tax=Curvibacter symbiont subsp. Hydra magnipapillata TaxID=667019 RepID=C9Y6P0_CURXX|nr:hypothetical protein Csp_E36170 [Curvibacter putative symbiont of Hydra magnipapillata]
MATSYRDLKAQIEELTAKAEAARVSEVAAVVADIKEKIEEYGLTASDLGFKTDKGTRKSVGQAIAEANEKKSVEPKYKGPNGELWSGRGRAPVWTQNLPTDKTLDDYKV